MRTELPRDRFGYSDDARYLRQSDGVQAIEREIEANRIDDVLARTGGVIDDKGVVRFLAN